MKKLGRIGGALDRRKISCDIAFVTGTESCVSLRGGIERQFDLAQVNEGHLQAWDHWHLRNLAERFCGLELVEWGSDATILSGISTLSQMLFGPRFTIRLETGLFRRLFPYHSITVLGLFRVRSEAPCQR